MSQTVLPRYTDPESESAPLLASTGVDVKDDFKGISGQYQDIAAPAPQRRCARFGWCKRWSREPECENRRCARRRKVARIFLFIIGAFFLFHLVKFGYTIYTLPRKIQCNDITDSMTTIELPLSKNILFHRSLSTSDLSVVRDKDTAEGSFKVQVTFDSIEGHRNESVICHGKFKKAWIFGAFTKDEGESLPAVKQATLILPVSAPTPFIGFGLGGRRGYHCADKVIRMLLKLKKKEEVDD